MFSSSRNERAQSVWRRVSVTNEVLAIRVLEFKEECSRREGKFLDLSLEFCWEVRETVKILRD
jgi:hypothetical protein